MPLHYPIQTLAQITHATLLGRPNENCTISGVYTDSRTCVPGNQLLFVALVGPYYNAHQFCYELAQKGQKYFMVSEPLDLPEGTVQLRVPNTLQALHLWAAHHRTLLEGKVIAITGSNGKTIVKEWLFELCSTGFQVYKSPKSYNSQIGVPLSVLQAPLHKDLYLFEAGVSQHGEMQHLQAILKPDRGVFTHLGAVHNEGFESMQHKLNEKMSLFRESQTVYCHHLKASHPELNMPKNLPTLREIGMEKDFKVLLTPDGITLKTPTDSYAFSTPLKDAISIQNLSLSLGVALDLGCEYKALKAKVPGLKNLPMRLELLEAPYESTLINDTWTNDPLSLHHALEFLNRQKKQQQTCLILSDFHDATPTHFYQHTLQLLTQHHIDRFIGVGPKWTHFIKQHTLPRSTAYTSAEECMQSIQIQDFKNTAILIKGSRKFAMEKIAYHLERKTHRTILEVNLDHITHNYLEIKKTIPPKTQIMAMVKASAYGSGNYEVAMQLRHLGVDYLGVAYVDEGIALRNAGIDTPIMVLNAELQSVHTLNQYKLEPVVGSLSMLEQICTNPTPPCIHLEIDTGMHRMGFMPDQIPALCSQLKENNHLTIQSIMSHFASADNPDAEQENQKQITVFHSCVKAIEQTIGPVPYTHISNSAGTLAYGNARCNMVRLGLSLYGIQPFSKAKKPPVNLKPVFRFYTHITQIKTVEAGEGISYGGTDKATTPRQIAVIAVGYADGFNRKFSNGNMHVFVNQQKAPVVGAVCMDMTMIDVSEIPCKEGDPVILLGDEITVSDWAQKLQTIPYEILTSISQRVKRIFVSEQ